MAVHRSASTAACVGLLLLLFLGGCVRDDPGGAGTIPDPPEAAEALPDWAATLFRGVDQLVVRETADNRIRMDFEGHASEMASILAGRMRDADRFIFYQQLMVTGEVDGHLVSVVWSAQDHEQPDLTTGSWTVDFSWED